MKVSGRAGGLWPPQFGVHDTPYKNTGAAQAKACGYIFSDN
jgi:hypothetical protein